MLEFFSVIASASKNLLQIKDLRNEKTLINATPNRDFKRSTGWVNVNLIGVFTLGNNSISKGLLLDYGQI